jgi:hypothetical protein
MDAQTLCGLKIGNPNDFGCVGNANPGFVFGSRITVSSTTFLKKFGIIAGAASGLKIRMGLYTDVVVGPDHLPSTLVAQSGEFTLQQGVNEVDVADVQLSPADFWIIIQLESQTALARTCAGDNAYEAAWATRDYAAGLPATITDPNAYQDHKYNWYIVVQG